MIGDPVAEKPKSEQLHTPYINHVMGCRGCHAPTARYCAAGLALWADYTSEFIMEGGHRIKQRDMMLSVKIRTPHLFDALNARVREKLGE